MAEYIEREAALKTLCEEGCCEYDPNAMCGCNEWLAISAIPAADVAPVVRCKDCIHWNKDALACDTLPWVNSAEHANWYADDFCSYGERMGDDD